MRAFIAIPLPQSVREELAKLQQSISGVQWQNFCQYHLTLKFLGEISEGDIKQLQCKLAEIAIPCSAISLKGLGFFTDKKRPVVLWAGVEKDNSLMDLHKNIVNCCIAIGCKAEERSFKPHITLARIKGGTKQKILLLVEEYKQFQIPDIGIEGFVLYESKMTPGGATHHRLKTFCREKGMDSKK